jgi:membrane protein YqaA with SNARE-associated domain
LPSSNTTRDSLPASLDWIGRGPGTALAFLWGFAEGTLFFILPDVLLSFVVLFRPRRALLHMAAIVAGAVLAGAVMFTWSVQSDRARDAVARVPAVSSAMFDGAARDLKQYGVWGTSLGPVRGIPYKVYAVEAPTHSALWQFLLVTIPARLWRLVLVWIGFGGTGALLRKIARARLAPILHAVFWIVTYAIYWTTVK